MKKTKDKKEWDKILSGIKMGNDNIFILLSYPHVMKHSEIYVGVDYIGIKSHTSRIMLEMER